MSWIRSLKPGNCVGVGASVAVGVGASVAVGVGASVGVGVGASVGVGVGVSVLSLVSLASLVGRLMLRLGVRLEIGPLMLLFPHPAARNPAVSTNARSASLSFKRRMPVL